MTPIVNVFLISVHDITATVREFEIVCANHWNDILVGHAL